jgi:hypothetical protein
MDSSITAFPLVYVKDMLHISSGTGTVCCADLFCLQEFAHLIRNKFGSADNIPSQQGSKVSPALMKSFIAT